MKILYKLSLSLAVILSVCSCKLDQHSTENIRIDDPSDVFRTYNDVNRFAVGMDSYFRNATYGVFATTSDIQGDMFNATTNSGNRGGAPHTMNSQFNPSDYDVRAVWDGYYSSISSYNYFIENIHFALDNKEEKTKLTAAQREKVNVWVGNARFYRAYSYFELAKKFCGAYDQASAVTALGLPLVKEFDVNAKPKRATLQETIDFIKADLDIAEAKLSKVSGKVRAITPTKDAVAALKARVALWTRDWAGAIAAADGLIKKSTYALATTVEEMEQEWYYDNGTEDIMQLFSSLTEAPKSMGDYVFVGRFAGSNGAEMFYQFPDFLPNDRLVKLYAAGDTRGQVYITNLNTYNGDMLSIKTMVKYRGNPALTSAPYFDGKNMAKIFRISEMYLIKAEAEAQSGADAKTTLNLLQTARGAALSAGTMEDVKTEWARETVGEGVRIECLKRWGDGFIDRPVYAGSKDFVIKVKGYVEITVPAGYYKFTWPIPTNDMSYNENLKGQQNPDW